MHCNCWGLSIEFDCPVDYGAVCDSIESPNLEDIISFFPIAHIKFIIPRAEWTIGLRHLAFGHATRIGSQSCP